jgi:hypothetical protein
MMADARRTKARYKKREETHFPPQATAWAFSFRTIVDFHKFARENTCLLHPLSCWTTSRTQDAVTATFELPRPWTSTGGIKCECVTAKRCSKKSLDPF